MRKAIFLICLLFGLFDGVAQDRHYWSQMGGITAGLLGGSAIAGLKDNSSLYYNAAAMSFVNNPSISIGANTYRLRIVNIDNAFGDDLNQFNTQFLVTPDLIGGLLFSKKNDQFRFGYAINARFIHENNINFQNSRILENGDTYVGDFDSKNKGQETWLNSANSYRVNKNLAFGYTFIIAFRSQEYSNFIGAKLIPADENEAVSRMDSRIVYNYWNLKGLLRLSIALDYERSRFGWNITLPSLDIFGSANVKRELSLVNNPNILNNFPSDIVVTGSDQYISAKHKYPFSSSFGASFKLNNNDWLHFSAEVFFPIKKYTVFSSTNQPITHPKSVFDSLSQEYLTESNFLELSEQAKFVMNFSLGYENYISEKWGLLAGFRTDFNYDNSDNFDLREIRPYNSSWDIYYISGGVWSVIKSQKITAGLELGFSPETNIRHLVNFNGEDSPDYPLLGSPANSAKANQLIIRLFLGIEINFLTKQKKLEMETEF